MPRWHQGRVVLLGDAAWCLTLYSGMGASTGIAAGELLGTMIQRHPDDLPAALAAWEARMRPFITGQQAAALSERIIFTPHNRKELIMREGMMRLMSSPFLRRVTGGMKGGPKGMQAKHIDVAAP